MNESTVTEKVVTHTPGSWTCDVVVDDVTERSDHMIQPTYAINVSGHAWPILPKAEAHANARLIAAAPDLFALARELEQLVTTDSDDLGFHLRMVPVRVETVKALRAAIAKAEGGAR